MAANLDNLEQAIYNMALRNQVNVERYKSSQVKTVEPYLRNIAAYIVQRLSFADLTTYRRDRLQKLLKAITAQVTAEFSAFTVAQRKEWRKFATYQAQLEAANITKAISNPAFEAIVPATSQVAALAAATPLSLRNSGAGLDLDGYTKNWNSAQTQLIVGQISQGVGEGQTNAEIVRRVRGTASRRFKDGVIGQSYRQTGAYVRTVVQQLASVAREATMQENGVDEYRWLVTLDNRTCEICAGLSEETFELGKGPIPPAHPNCRCATVEVIPDEWAALYEGQQQSSQFGPVDADQTYYGWLKTQSASFQNEVLGPTNGKLFRNGGLDSKQFSNLRLDKTFKPQTLAEMQARNPAAFDKAGVELNPITGYPIDA